MSYKEIKKELIMVGKLTRINFDKAKINMTKEDILKKEDIIKNEKEKLEILFEERGFGETGKDWENMLELQCDLWLEGNLELAKEILDLHTNIIQTTKLQGVAK